MKKLLRSICSSINLRKQHIDLRKVKTVLIVATPGIGDAFLATPIARSLLAQDPELQIDFLVREGRADLLSECMEIRSVIEFRYRRKVIDYLRMVRKIFRRYDLAISTSTSDRAVFALVYAARWRASILPALSVSSVWKYALIKVSVVVDHTISVVDLNLQLIDALKVERKYQCITPAGTMGVITPGISAAPYAIVHCLPRERWKEWSFSSWKNLVNHLLHRGLRVYLTGGSGDYEVTYTNELARQTGEGVRSLAGQLSFRQLNRVLQGAQLYAGIDTFTSHLAAATGIPSFVVFGSVDPRKWGPSPVNNTHGTTFTREPGMQIRGNVTIFKAACFCVRTGENTSTNNSANPNYSNCPCIHYFSSSEIISAIDQRLSLPFRKKDEIQLHGKRTSPGLHSR